MSENKAAGEKVRDWFLRDIRCPECGDGDGLGCHSPYCSVHIELLKREETLMCESKATPATDPEVASCKLAMQSVPECRSEGILKLIARIDSEVQANKDKDVEIERLRNVINEIADDLEQSRHPAQGFDPRVARLRAAKEGK